MANITASKNMNEKKKVPQRGLGIAQIERIRLEEQHGLVFGHNLNFPSVMQQRCQQHQKTSSSTSIMAGVKRPYPFSPEYRSVPSFRYKNCCVAPVSRSHEFSVNVEERNALRREVMSKSRALSESEPSSSVREIKGLTGDFLRLAPPAEALTHLGAANRHSLTDSAPKCLQLFDYVPSRVAAAEPTPPSGLSISVQQPILRFFPSAKAQIDQEGTRGSDIRTEVGGNIELELKL